MSSPDRTKHTFRQPHLWLIALLGVIVPRRLRGDWRHEWHAELQNREALLADWHKLNLKAKFDLFRRSLGAFRDALVLQPQRLEDELVQDLRYGGRMLLKNPGFAVVAVLTLALGIGANTAIFSIVNAVLFRPLPYHVPDRLFMLWTVDSKHGVQEAGTSYLNFLDWRTQGESFADLAIFRNEPVTITHADDTERVSGGLVSASLFSMLGVNPMLGRCFSSDEEEQGDRVMVLSYSYWQKRFGGNAEVIDKTLDLVNIKGLRNATRIIGVMPPEFYFPTKETPFWVPATSYWRWQRESSERYVDTWRVIGRLKPQATLPQAQTEMHAIGQRLAQSYPTTDPYFPGFQVNLVPLLDQVTGKNLQRALWVLLAAATLVLLLACVNVANLLLARGTAREREFAIRAALGASRSRILRQLLVESVLLSTGAGLVGLSVAAAGVRVLSASDLVEIPRFDEVQIDVNVLFFTIGVSVLAGILFGLVPGWKISHRHPNETLKEGSATKSGMRLGQAGGMLVAAQCALAVVLLTGAGLLIRSFLQLQAVDPGFKPEGVMLIRVSPPMAIRGAASEEFFHQLRDRIAGLPGVQDVAAIGDFLLRRNFDESVTIPGRPPLSEGEANQLASENVTPGFFQTMRVPLLSGRLLTRADALAKVQLVYSPTAQNLSRSGGSPQAPAEAVIVNKMFAQRFFPGEDPIGKRFSEGPSNRVYCYEIVGVVGDMHRQGLETEPIPEFFGSHISGPADLAVRAESGTSTLPGMLRETIRSFNNASIVSNVTTVERRMGDLAAQRRLNTWLLAMFASLALALASIGIYGLTHYSVEQRTREIGIRIALGARGTDVLRMVIGQGMKLTLVGVSTGVLTAMWLTRAMSHLLFGVSAQDPATFLGVALTLVSAALLACYLPARKASKVDPLVALRYD